MKQRYSRELLQLKIEEAQRRKKEIEDQKVERSKFQMLKWDLYRKKCEQIDDAYATFKKTQLKIFWWLKLLLTHRIMKRSFKNFIDYREIVL